MLNGYIFNTSGKFLAVIIAAVKGRVNEATVGVQIEAKRFSEIILILSLRLLSCHRNDELRTNIITK